MAPTTFRRLFGTGERDPRLPPGQYDTGNTFPVLTAEVSPRLKAEDWSLRVDGLVETPKAWTWSEIHKLPDSTYNGDIHCVTTWSKLGTSFTGVSVDDLFAEVGVRPEATHIVAWSVTGYTTNLPIEHVVGGKAWVAGARPSPPPTPPAAPGGGGQGGGGGGAKEKAAATGARRPGPHARAAPL